MNIKVVATEDIDKGDRVFCHAGMVRRAHVGADRNAGLALNPVKRGELATYNDTTRELRRTPGR